jgi:hypothetical protein
MSTYCDIQDQEMGVPQENILSVTLFSAVQSSTMFHYIII